MAEQGCIAGCGNFITSFDDVQRALDNVDALLESPSPAWPFVSALPPAAGHGDEVYYKSGAMPGYWHLKYDAFAAGPYKWYFVGGAPVHAETTTITTQTFPGVLGTYADVTNAANVVPPLAGDYNVGFGWSLGKVAGGSAIAALSVFSGGVQVLTELLSSHDIATALKWSTSYSICGASAIAAGATLTMRATSTDGAANAWEHRSHRMSAWPVRVG